MNNEYSKSYEDFFPVIFIPHARIQLSKIRDDNNTQFIISLGTQFLSVIK